jgi:lysozyme
MNVSDLIKSHEGLSLKLYKCPADRWTIGYGRNVEDRGISPREAEYLLACDIQQFREQLTRDYPWFTSLSEVRQAAMTDLIYNVGPGNLKKFVKFLAAMARGDWERAGDELVQSKWYTQVRNRAPRIVMMIRTGGWPP